MKIRTEAEQKSEMINCIIWAGICLMFLHVLTGCTLHVGVDWNGETAKDNRTFTQQEKK
jgi:hypothetical protein